jgi:hypothetical protein
VTGRTGRTGGTTEAQRDRRKAGAKGQGAKGQKAQRDKAQRDRQFIAQPNAQDCAGESPLDARGSTEIRAAFRARKFPARAAILTNSPDHLRLPCSPRLRFLASLRLSAPFAGGPSGCLRRSARRARARCALPEQSIEESPDAGPDEEAHDDEEDYQCDEGGDEESALRGGWARRRARQMVLEEGIVPRI